MVYTKCSQECLYILMLHMLQILRLGEDLDMNTKEQWRKWGSVRTCKCAIRTLLLTLVLHS